MSYNFTCDVMSYMYLTTTNPYGDKNHPVKSLWTETELDSINKLLLNAIYEDHERREDMPVRRNWTDPITNEKFGYDWGFDLSNPSDKKTSSEIVYKYSKCVRCANHGTYRCNLCDASTKYFIEKSTDTNKVGYHLFKEAIMPARSGKNHYVKEYLKMFYGVYTIPQIKDVIFNDPATIVFWEDGTKTVVKVMEGDEFDPYTGLAQAISKKALGNDYRKEFKKWTKPYYKKKADEEKAALEEKTKDFDLKMAVNEAVSAIRDHLCKDAN